MGGHLSKLQQIWQTGQALMFLLKAYSCGELSGIQGETEAGASRGSHRSKQ